MKNALILSGGGAKGDFQAGVINALSSKGINFNYVAGVSVGALNGIMVATEQIQQMMNIWQNISPDQIYSSRGLFKVGGNYLLHKIGITEPRLGYYSNEPLHNLIRKNVLGKRVRKSYYAGIVSDRTGRYSEHNIKGGGNYLVDAKDIKKILASTAIPGVFDPVKIDGDYYVDGGVRHATPIGDVLKRHNPDKVYIVVTRNESKEKNNKSKDIIDIVKNSFDYLMERSFESDIERFIEINNLVKQSNKFGTDLYNVSGTRKYKYYDYEIIYPKINLGDSLDFNAKKAIRNIRHGKSVVNDMSFSQTIPWKK